MTPLPERSQLFISYSHRYGERVEWLQTMLRPLEQRCGLKRWDDSRIQPGSLWREEIEEALFNAKVALLLVSDEFLASSSFKTSNNLLMQCSGQFHCRRTQQNDLRGERAMIQGCRSCLPAGIGRAARVRLLCGGAETPQD